MSRAGTEPALHPNGKHPDNLRVGLFTDTLDEINGVARFIRDMGEQALKRHRHFIIHTCAVNPRFNLPNRKNFPPMLGGKLPYYAELEMNFPPVPDILEWAGKQRFDAIHLSTPGLMGLCGHLVAAALKLPILGTYHTDFPAYLDRLCGQKVVTEGCAQYMRLFYCPMTTVFARSQEYRRSLTALGIAPDRLATILPCINTDKFNTTHLDPTLFDRLGIGQPLKILYCGRVSKEKNLSILVEAFQQLCEQRNDTALIVAGDGPYLAEMKNALKQLPAHFLGYQNDAQLGVLYPACDLFIFPSRTDTLGQVVMEAQSSGLPVIVSDTGGPKEICENNVTGVVVQGENPADWRNAINALLDDQPRRLRMSQSAPARIARFSLDNTFEAFWAQHAKAAIGPSLVRTH